MENKIYNHPITGEEMTRDEYFDFMFGEEFMRNKDPNKKWRA